MIYTQSSNNQIASTVQKSFSNVTTFHFYPCKMLVSSIKGQIWHLNLQQGALLLSEDDSHLI